MMCKNFRIFILLALSLFYSSFVFSEQEIEYRFERLWPQLDKQWYLDKPNNLAIASNGDVYVSDSENHRIMHFNNRGDFIGTWGSLGSGNEQFNAPDGIAIASNGDVYVSDSNHVIKQFSSDGKFIRAWENRGAGNGQFFFPERIAIAPDDTVYIADKKNNRIQQFSSTGEFIKTWGNGEILNYSDNDYFDNPISLAITQDGNVYVEDSRGIRQFSADGVFIRTLGEDNQFLYPRGIAIAPSGNIYIADLCT